MLNFYFILKTISDYAKIIKTAEKPKNKDDLL
jgi:hypothetical protein